MKTQLNDQIDLITNPKIARLVRLTLDAAPECFWTMPASTTGKYHPRSSLGTGGLIRHTRTVCILTRHLLHMRGLEPDHPDYAACLAAAILHDCCKKRDDERHTAFDHPLRASSLIIRTAALIGPAEPFSHAVSVIAAIVASHMGRWNTSPRHPGIILPRPLTPNQQLIHTADYLASRPDITLTGI